MRASQRTSGTYRFKSDSRIEARSDMTGEISRAISGTAYQTYEKRLLREVMSNPVPHHVAVIMDGNRRYAAEMGMLVSDGHEKGKQKLEEMLEWCIELGIRVLTVYAFSTENVGRQKDEIEILMGMFVANFRRLGDDERVHKHKIRVRVLGQRDILPAELQDSIRYAEDKTKDYDRYSFNIAVGYGGREEIVHVIKKLATAVKSGELSVEDISQKVVAEYLYTSEVPDPDLILRTSGEERISNFLLWQIAYSELYFSDVYWPGFRKIDFLRAVRSYQQRTRGYGR